MKPKSLCYRNGNLASFQVLFAEQGKISSQWTFNEDEKLVKFESFNLEGEQVQLTNYKPLGQNLYETSQIRKSDTKQVRVVSTFEIDLFPEVHEQLRSSIYSKNNKKFLKEEFERGLITAVETYLDDGTVERRYEVTTINGEGATRRLQQFKVFDKNRRQIGQYHENTALPPVTTSSKLPAVIMDTGIDFTHPRLKDKMASVRGLGIFPDTMQMGWYFDPFTQKDSPVIIDQIYYQLGQYPYIPFSHGTHVAGVAIDGIEKFGLVGFTGDYSEIDFLNKISDWLLKSSVHFVNMSFGFGDRENPFGANSNARAALVSLMSSNPQALFVVAAGNESADLDDPKKDDVPTKAPVTNKIVVAAMETDKIELDKLETYKLAAFSNRGVHTVDVAAAGDDVDSTNVGGGTLRVSGTSAAAPSVMNTALRIAEVNPALTALQVKYLINCTAYRPRANPLPLISRGIMIRERAVLAARLSLSIAGIKEACAQARTDLPLGLENKP